MAYRITLIYDANCAFCRWAVRLFDSWDKRNVLRFVPCQSEERKREFSSITTEECMEAMQAILRDGARKPGFDAVAHLMKNLQGWQKAAGVFMVYLPGASIIGRVIYRWVAKNRYKIKCNDDTCHI